MDELEILDNALAKIFINKLLDKACFFLGGLFFLFLISLFKKINKITLTWHVGFYFFGHFNP